MSTTKQPPLPSPSLPPAFYYAPLPPQAEEPNYVLLPLYRRPASRRLRRTLCTVAVALLALLLVYLSWPSDPTIKIVRLRLTRIHIQRKPRVLVDASLSVTLKVRNADIYSLDYRTLDVAVGYRGKELGNVRAEQGRIRALGSSYVDADMELYGVDLLSDVVFLLEDLAKGLVQFDTMTQVQGQLGLLFFGFPLKAKVSCEVLVNTKNQTLVRQNCYPE